MQGAHISQEQADEFAIGSLEPELERLVVLHAAACDRCRDLVQDAQRIASSLAFAVPRREAPLSLKRRVMAAAGITGPSPIVVIGRWARAAAGIAAVFIAIAAFTAMVSMRGQVSDLRDQNAQLQAQIDEALSQKVEILALTQRLREAEDLSGDLQNQAKMDRELMLAMMSPESDTAEVIPVDPTGASPIGRLIWDSEQKRVYFVASGLRELPEGQTYELWVNANGQYRSLGAFNADPGGFARHVTFVPQGIETYDSAVVTIETRGGPGERTGPGVFFVADLSRLQKPSP